MKIKEDDKAFIEVARIFNSNIDEMFFVGDIVDVDIIPANKLGITTAIVNSISNSAKYQLNELYDLEAIPKNN